MFSVAERLVCYQFPILYSVHFGNKELTPHRILPQENITSEDLQQFINLNTDVQVLNFSASLIVCNYQI